MNKILYPYKVSEVEQISQELAWALTTDGEVIESDSIEIGTIEPGHDATVETVSESKPTSEAMWLFQPSTPAYTLCDETTRLFQATDKIPNPGPAPLTPGYFTQTGQTSTNKK